VPQVEVALSFPNAGGAVDTRVTGTYGSGDPPVLIGGTVEATSVFAIFTDLSAASEAAENEQDHATIESAARSPIEF